MDQAEVGDDSLTGMATKAQRILQWRKIHRFDPSIAIPNPSSLAGSWVVEVAAWFGLTPALETTSETL